MRLKGEARELDAQSRRLGVHAVGPAHGQRVHMRTRAIMQRSDQRKRSRQDHLADRLQL